MTRQREDFFFTMARECPDIAPSDVAVILRLAATHGRIQEESCNGVEAERQARNEKTEHRVQRALIDLGQRFGFEPVFSGDPRGATVKLKVRSGRYDDWGQTGICVPQ